MKKCLTMAIVSAVAAPIFALSLADASAKISDIVAAPEGVKAVVSELSKDDQVKFLGRLNSGISKTQESGEAKTAKFVAVNKAALLAHKGNLKELIAEMFATVSPEALVVVNERFAAELFSRNVNPARPVSDEQMKSRALDTMKVVHARNAGNANSSVRDTFAILMFLRAAKGSPADLADVLVAGIADSEARTLAKEEWIPAAMGIGREKSYDPILAACDASVPLATPDAEVVNRFVNAQGPAIFTGSLMADLSPAVNSAGKPTVSFTEQFLDPNKYALPSEGVAGLNRVPRTLNPDDPWYPKYDRDDVNEAGKYRGQTTKH